MKLLSEKTIQRIIFNFPDLIGLDVEPYKMEKSIEKLNQTLRYDALFKVKGTSEFILVEIKKYSASYDDMAQVMEYYSLLTKKGYNITKVCLLANYFEPDLKTALKYCNIEALEYQEEKITSKLDNNIDEMKTGIINHPYPLKEEIGEFPELPLNMVSKELRNNLIREYEEFKQKFKFTLQAYALEIWEFKVTHSCYLVSIKHNGTAIHAFKQPYTNMASTKHKNSTRYAVWNYFKIHDGGIPYSYIGTQSYTEEQGLKIDKYSINRFSKKCIPLDER
ncbi:hypothetical protein P4K49_02435 [Bacillus cereus]|uniref:hypothetical protein n=1 Tax=Bacillus thuringiensis TaxID=1428 RepID=UPI000676E083|nr:hypothetical protein [Bacillus thuringiensis]MEB8878113.1 hypothetical protein [Bacillus cereus]HDR7461845.1 hypothetical protein [Bacillus toyonensis]AKR34227.1 Hypothetical protein NF53_1149 [Bacillus thuringiensis serovar indiana]MBG9645223.1 hypothetical protein [Bacillus thuringiensis]MBG9651259.1 hypothetical protein [Bacillus thuringiensis]